MAQGDVADGMAGQAGEIGAVRAIVRAGHAIEDEAPDDPRRGPLLLGPDPPAIAQEQEQRGFGAHDADIGEKRILGRSAIDALPGDRRQGEAAAQALHGLVGAAQFHVAHQHVAALALRIGAELQRVAGAVDAAFLHQHPLRRTLRCQLETKRVILGIDQAIAHDHVAAAIDVAAVIVEIGLVVDREVLDQQLVAIEVVLHPAGGIAQGEAADMDAFAIEDADQEGPARRAVRPFGARKMILAAAPVDDPPAGQGDILAPLGEDQRLVHPHIAVHHRRAAGDTVGIVGKVEAGQQPRAGLDLEADIAAEIERAGDEVAAGQQHGAAAFGRHGLDRRLDRRGASAVGTDGERRPLPGFQPG
ncbi:conserved hypothetical protein, partial [Ricinus communis]